MAKAFRKIFHGESRRLRVLIVGMTLALVAGCAGGDEEPAYVERPVEDLYNEAMDTLESGSHTQAAKLFDEVDRQHPYSPWASKAQLMAAYAHYLESNYDESISGLDRFIQLHPGNSDAPYAYYLKALSYYEQISDVGRDQKMTRSALTALQDLTRRFPESEYTKDAELKIDLTKDHLAGKEMSVGRFYQSRGHYLSAINRFRTVVDEYETTSHTPEALHRLVECYMALGIVAEARETAAVLGYNFPGSDWYQDSYALVGGLGDQALPQQQQ